MRASKFAPLLGFQQLPIHQPSESAVQHSNKMPLFVDDFTFKAGHDVFTPKDLIELARPGVSVANLVGDLILTPVSKYSFDSKTFVLLPLPFLPSTDETK